VGVLGEVSVEPPAAPPRLDHVPEMGEHGVHLRAPRGSVSPHGGMSLMTHVADRAPLRAPRPPQAAERGRRLPPRLTLIVLKPDF
jgi:hypothetical protein